MLFFFGCYQYQEDIWVNEDFSGSLEASYVAPFWVNIDSTKSLRIKNSIDSLPGIELIEWIDYFTDSNRVFTFRLNFSHIDSLRLLKDPQALVHHFETSSITKNRKGEFVYTREVSPSHNDLPQFQFDSGPFRQITTIHFDSKIKKVKGAYTSYKKGGKVVKWAFEGAFPLNKPVKIEIVLQK